LLIVALADSYEASSEFQVTVLLQTVAKQLRVVATVSNATDSARRTLSISFAIIAASRSIEVVSVESIVSLLPSLVVESVFSRV
jgi:hypothetical protein